jgi:tetratricopeptide (TPR) repeat protein
MDPNNPIVVLCTEGMEAEADQRPDAARALFERAWRESKNDVEACIAAHYVARHQPSLDRSLWWNQLALARANGTRDPRVRPFYSSLHLNLGKVYEDLGREVQARMHYEKAEEFLAQISDGSYRALVEFGVRRAMSRV